MSDDLTVLYIPDNTKYWFIRANTKAEFYDDFQYNNFIAIGDNDVSLSELKNIPKYDRVSKDILEAKYKQIFTNVNIKKYEEIHKDHPESALDRKEHLTTIKRSSAIAASKAFKFVEEMQIGDIVLVPNNGTTEFMLGFITSEVFDSEIDHIVQNDLLEDTESSSTGYPVSNFEKKRRVFWIKEISRKELPDKLSWVVNARQAVHNISENAKDINPLISSKYIFNNSFHARLGVTTTKKISTNELFQLQKVIVEIAKDKSNEIFQRTSVQSPGQIILQTIQDNWSYIVLIISLLVGKISVPIKNGGTATVKGLIPYFFGKEHKLDIKSKETDIKAKEEKIRGNKLDNDLKELKVKEKILELNKKFKLDNKSAQDINIPDLSAEDKKKLSNLGLTNADVGDEMTPESQMDNLNFEEDESSEK
ncbi:hypothetical protein LMB96_06040 [Limosilactobacillus reuteri]|uniref:hypothetical protein n=1 Tax=Limosilactobacillus reuteri TaxID=1598 RepID=UPI001E4C4121|nr:hypothetical protein [Limosilactobacillus reuteri]MCC4421895.1 hypothetical protein [Limosilactobacillus reuteri]